MKYQQFKIILNTSIFNDTTSKADLLEKIANSPSRYIGLFRPTLPKLKLLQNLTQSQEIRFGDAFEKLIGEYLAELGYTNLEKRYLWNNEHLNVDQCFTKNDKYYFAEQKVRDDHDSTKKRGQIENFSKKVDLMLSKYGNNLEGFMFFIDPDLEKNKNYYKNEIKILVEKHNIQLYVCYGKDFFEILGHFEVWDDIINNLKQWRTEIPDMPELNFDLDSQDTFNQVKNLETSVLQKLFQDDEIWNEIILTLFPTKETLFLLKSYFKSILTQDIKKQQKMKYEKLLVLLNKRLEIN